MNKRKDIAYIALLRGINVGGKNKVAMSELRECFESLGFTGVSTYINSGNVLFSGEETDTAVLVKRCEAAIEKRFGFPVVTMVITADELRNAMNDAPAWWRSSDPKEFRSDALFIIPPVTAEQALAEIQKKSSAVDRFAINGQVIFWSLIKADYNKSVVPKIIGTPTYRSITIRSSTTAKKLLQLLDAE